MGQQGGEGPKIVKAGIGVNEKADLLGGWHRRSRLRHRMETADEQERAGGAQFMQCVQFVQAFDKHDHHDSAPDKGCSAVGIPSGGRLSMTITVAHS
jgi:hypothetical protein